MRNLTLVLMAACITCAACKSTKKLFDEGQYDRALYSALDDLKKKPDNPTAASILPQAYNEAVDKYRNSIDAARMGVLTPQKLGIIYNDYRALQKMYDAIAATPAARGLVTATSYTTELATAAENAAAFSYAQGDELLQRGDRISAQHAIESFTIAERYVPGYQQVEEKKQQALDLAIVNIVVSKFDQRFGSYSSVNGSYFQNDVVYNLNSIGNGHYYNFYGPTEAQVKDVRVDQYMDIDVHDIWFGQLASNSYSYDVSKDISVEDDKDPKVKKTITVTATVNVTRRVVDSRAMMEYRITDQASQRMIANDRVPAQYSWEKLTGNYKGDQRALGDKDWAIIRGAYNNQPAYDDLYRELTRRMMNDFNYRMRNIYGR
ncbi:MAG TPA: hypothetical protein VGM41_17560 [Chitinophagaceae bacterium]|jgi:hypothetical protein